MADDIVVITGATGGIGREISRSLGRSGKVVVAHYRQNHAEATELARSLGSEGISCHPIDADLATDAGLARVVSSIDDLLSRNPSYCLHALVNNAAALLGPSFLEASPTQFDAYFALNVRAPFFLSQQLATRMRPGGGIVNISSASAHFSSPGDIVYAMSKAALESLTRNMAEAIAPLGLRVNTVIPGFTDNGHPAFDRPEVLDYMSTFAVLSGVATPDVVADAVEFLISDKASRTTGATLDVSGGSTLSTRGSRSGTVRSLLH